MKRPKHGKLKKADSRTEVDEGLGGELRPREEASKVRRPEWQAVASRIQIEWRGSD